MTIQEYDEFVSVIKTNEAALGQLQARMKAVLVDESLSNESKNVGCRKVVDESKQYTDAIERAWNKLHKTL